MIERRKPATNLKEELLNLIRTLNADQLQYAVCGGLAMTVHGFVSSTVDIDLLVPEVELQQVLKTAETAGFWIPRGRMPFRAKTPMAMDIYRVSKAQGTVLISLDLIIVSEGLLEIWESIEFYEVDNVVCPMVSRSGLIQMKTIAGRPQDLVDIQRLTKGE